MSLPVQAKRYLRGALAAGFNGGISSLAGIAGIDAARATTGAGTVTLLSVKEMGAAFIGGCAIHFVMWLKAHPLDENYDTTASIIPGTTPKP